jgi:prenyltransferase beta subunit
LFESEDKVQKSVKLNEEETNTQEENTLKLGLKTTKGSHRSRKRQESSKHFKDEDSKTADGHLEGDRSGEVTSKGMYCAFFLLYIVEII